jgi:hypothetical protein
VKFSAIKAVAPPRSGDHYRDPIYGRVILIKPGGGYSWHCKPAAGNQNRRMILSPAKMQRVRDDEPTGY